MHILARYCPGPVASSQYHSAAGRYNYYSLPTTGTCGLGGQTVLSPDPSNVLEVWFYRWLSSKFFLGPTAYSVLQSMACFMDILS
jgi:hypothetical protein